MPPDRPVALHHLSFAGQLVVWTARHWVACHGDCPTIEREFSGPLGARAGRALAEAFDGLYGLMNAAARRPMIFGPLNCRQVWRDEGLIVRLVEMAQQGCTGWVLERLGDILPTAAARRAVVQIDAIAGLLAEAGYAVSLDTGDEDRGLRPDFETDLTIPAKIVLH